MPDATKGRRHPRDPPATGLDAADRCLALEDDAAVARLRGITRSFGRVVALDGIDFALRPGEIHGLLGENGAGKTTLARVMAGLLAPDRGRIEIGGRSLNGGGARAARELGVAMVHQHLSLVPRFTGFENVLLFNGDGWTRRGGLRREFRARVESRAAELGLDVELDLPVERLGMVERQRVEILKALAGPTRVLILDEPTTVLAPQEVAGLFAVLARVARAGTGIVLVAHKLDEVLGATDRVTVLRGGRRVLTRPAGAVTEAGLVTAMVGRGGVGGVGKGGGTAARALELGGQADGGGTGQSTAGKERSEDARQEDGGRVAGAGDATAEQEGGECEAGPPVAALRGVTAGDPEGERIVDLSLEVRRGEIVGIAGVGGNGQRALAEVLAGVRAPTRGEVRIPREVGWIPQDRVEEGLVGDFTVAENVAFAVHGRPDFRNGPWFDWGRVRETAARMVAEMEVRGGGAGDRAGRLSGGNQQKVVAGREFLRSRDLFVAESPTRGLDVRATAQLRARIAALARSGPHPPGIVLISADLDEILDLADRILVMVRSRLLPLPPRARHPEAVGRLMLAAAVR